MSTLCCVRPASADAVVALPGVVLAYPGLKCPRPVLLGAPQLQPLRLAHWWVLAATERRGGCRCCLVLPILHCRYRETNAHLVLQGQPRVVRVYHTFQGKMMVPAIKGDAVPAPQQLEVGGRRVGDCETWWGLLICYCFEGLPGCAGAQQAREWTVGCCGEQ